MPECGGVHGTVLFMFAVRSAAMILCILFSVKGDGKETMSCCCCCFLPEPFRDEAFLYEAEACGSFYDVYLI